MMEKESPNSSEGQQGWFSARNGSGSSLDLESVVQPLALNPWDVVLSISGTIISWGASICYGLLPVMGWNCLKEPSACSIVRPLTKNHLVILSVSFFAVFAVMLQLYVQICRIVCRHAHQIAVQRHLLASAHYVTTRKGIATLAVILGTFASCWLPFAVYGLLGDYSYPALYTYVTLLPATYNSMLNPVIYAFRNQEIQKVLWAVCCGCFSSTLPFRSRSPSDV